MRRNRGKAGLGTGGAVLILIAIVVVAYVAVPSFQVWLNGVFSGVKGWWNQNYGNYLTLRITYEDGSIKDYSPSSGLSQSIMDVSTNKQISSIALRIAVTPTYTGTMQSWVVTGSILKVILQGTTTVKTLTSNSCNKTSTSIIASGTEYNYTVGTWSPSGIQSWMTYTEGTTYTLSFVPSTISMTITFSDGTSQTQQATPLTVNWNFKYQSTAGPAGPAFTSLSVSFSQSSTYV